MNLNKYYFPNARGSIGVIDSGIGGITVLSRLIERLPLESFIYLADKSGAPYGDKSEEYILSRTVANCQMLIERGAKAIVVACNTATNVGITELRQNNSFLSRCIFVGAEPAIKPAVEATQGGNILVLLTPATARQPKFYQLVGCFPNARIIVSPQEKLATLIENNINNLSIVAPIVEKILSAYHNVESVVLGCTHYVYLRQIISCFYNESSQNIKNQVKIFDGNEGIANRLVAKLKENNLATLSNHHAIEFIVR